MGSLTFLLSLLAFAPSGPSAFQEEVGQLLRIRIEQHTSHTMESLGDQILWSQVLLPEIYRERFFEPVWFEGGKLKQIFPQLLELLATAPLHGLDAQPYHLARLQKLWAYWKSGDSKLSKPLVAMELDLLASDGLLIFTNHLASGAVNYLDFDPNWHADRAETDLKVLFQQALKTGDIKSQVQALLPQHPFYAKLQEALAYWVAQPEEHGIEPLALGKKVLRPGESDPQIAMIRQRLDPALGESLLYDKAVVQLIIKLQKENGLEGDGLIGNKTRTLLNRSRQGRINQLRANLERWRWLPRSLGQRHILVNIAAFKLWVVNEGEAVMNMDVIVGRPFRESPIFSAEMTYLVLSPYWQVPQALILKDKSDILKKTPEKLQALKFRIYDGWGADAKELDLMKVSQQLANSKNFPYRMRQDPGPQNALGDVKFMFPNQFNVYLHDTPDRELFKKTERSFSSGCIRISKPMELAEYLLKDTAWNRERILATIQAGKETSVPLPKRFRVHILYWTVAVEDNQVHFLSDVYERDQRLIQALNALKNPS